jgi:hypothetical protein
MNTMRRMGAFVGLMGLVALGSPYAKAQAEIDPDHFDAPNMEAIRPANPVTLNAATAMRYEGKFTLPQSVQCNGENLASGEYSITLRSDGKTAEATLQRGEQVIRIRGVAREQTSNKVHDALIVERSGGLRRLSAVHVGQVDLVFGSAAKAATIEELPLLLNRLS